MRKNYEWHAIEVDNRNDFVDAIGEKVFIVYRERRAGEIIPLLEDGIREGKHFIRRKVRAGLSVAIASMEERFADVKNEDEMGDELKYTMRRAERELDGIGIALTDYHFIVLQAPTETEGGIYGFLYIKNLDVSLDTLYYNDQKIDVVYAQERNKKKNKNCPRCGSALPSEPMFARNKDITKRVCPKCGNVVYNLFYMNAVRTKKGRIELAI